MRQFACLMTAAFISGASWAAGGDVPLEHANTNLSDQASLQRGAGLFTNYCLSCHSLGYQRWNRMATDLGLKEEDVLEYMIQDPNTAFADHMETSMSEEDQVKWLGAAAPDLSLTARSKGHADTGGDWIYTFLKGFYLDPTTKTGWNNTVLANASMPHVLWELQGIQKPIYGEDGKVESLELVSEGSMSPEEYDQAMTDITNFLEYVGEPAALKRAAIGPWVLIYLALFSLLAYFMKEEYWKDVK
jgi:ubiquinol-cytochrome c reductase cytochrome c1 subunit